MHKDKIDPNAWESIKAKYDYRCLKCGRREPDITLQPDRIVPKVKGGDYSPENVQPLCEHCKPSKREQNIDFRTEQKVRRARRRHGDSLSDIGRV